MCAGTWLYEYCCHSEMVLFPSCHPSGRWGAVMKIVPPFAKRDLQRCIAATGSGKCSITCVSEMTSNGPKMSNCGSEISQTRYWSTHSHLLATSVETS